MQYLAQIVNGINAAIKATLDDKRFQTSLYFGIAILADDNGKLRPLVTDHYDDDVFISPDTKIPLTIYHRTLQITRTTDRRKTYGSDPGAIIENASMCLIAMGSRKLIRLTPEELEGAISAGMPALIAKNTTDNLNLSRCEIQLTSSILDQVQIYQQETKSDTFDLPPNELMIRVNYTILSTYKTACFNLCDC